MGASRYKVGYIFDIAIICYVLQGRTLEIFQIEVFQIKVFK